MLRYKITNICIYYQDTKGQNPPQSPATVNAICQCISPVDMLNIPPTHASQDPLAISPKAHGQLGPPKQPTSQMVDFLRWCHGFSHGKQNLEVNKELPKIANEIKFTNQQDP